MKYIAIFAAVMSLLTVPARCKGASPEDELAKAAFAFEVAKLSLKSPTPVKRTTCNCDATGKCQCFVGECQCASCGLGVGPAKKALPGMKATDARPAGISPLPGKEPGSSASSPVPSISINARSASPLGGTDCASGNCPSAASYRRGFFFTR